MSLDKAGTAGKFTPRIVEKRWDHTLERKLFDIWQKEGVYAFRLQKDARPFVIDTPPPYPSGTWHIGAVAQ